MPTILDSSEQRHAGAIAQNLLIVSVAAILCLPYLIHGLAPTGDSILHTTYQYQFSRQFWSGDFYPRWMMSANKGYGSPIFLIQYPLPYWITALLRPLTRFAPTPSREARELGVYCFLILAAAGLNARLWLQKSHAPLAATTAAMLYISLPYFLAYGIYSDLAIGQLTAFAWMPLALAASDSLRLRFTAVSALGLAWALLVLSNFLTALIFAPFMVAYAITRRESNHMSLAKCVVSILVSLAIGTCVAAVYVFPFFANLKLFNINALLSLPGYELSYNLAFVRLASLHKLLVVMALCCAFILTGIAARSIRRGGGSAVPRLCMLLTLGLGVLMITPGLGSKLIGLSGLTPPVFKVVDYLPERMLAMALMTFALGVFAYSKVSEDSALRQDFTQFLLPVTACVALILMLPWSAFLWHSIPLVATAVQFPHRLCILLTLAVTGIFAAALDDCLHRQATRGGNPPAMPLMLMVVTVILGGVLTWRADWTWRQVLRNSSLVHADELHDVDHTYRTYVSQDHLAGFANLIGAVPNQVQPEEVAAGQARLVQGQGIVNVVRESPRNLRVSYSVSGQGQARIGLAYSPLWKIERTGDTSNSAIVSSSADGLVEVPLAPGRHDLELVFDVGWPERYGFIVTVVSIGCVFGGMIIQLTNSKLDFKSFRF